MLLRLKEGNFVTVIGGIGAGRSTMQIEENLALAKAERERYIEQLKILDLGLESRMAAKVGLLSGGQRQVLTLLMYDGRVVVDVSGEEKNLTVKQLLSLFSQASGSDEVNDKMVLS